MNFPEDLKYTNDHEWIKAEGNMAYVGVTEHAAGELGDVVYIDIPDPEAELSAGDTFATIEAVKTVADMFSPVSGKIVEVNTSLEDAPETVNSDPYGDGWIVTIEMSDPSELDSLLDVNAYKEIIGQ